MSPLELVKEVERYQLEKVGRTFTHSTDYGTDLLEMGWILAFSEVGEGKKCRSVVGKLTARVEVIPQELEGRPNGTVSRQGEISGCCLCLSTEQGMTGKNGLLDLNQCGMCYWTSVLVMDWP